jgi:hypothetical protein
MVDYSSIHAGDEIVIGKMRGWRFWTYQFVDPRLYHGDPPRTISSWQHDHEWVASRPTEPNALPTMENGRGINIYKTAADALEGSADAINAAAGPQLAKWIECQGGIVLGEVEFWGETVEYTRGYRAQYVIPVCFDRAWGYEPEQIVDDLNLLWFADKSLLGAHWHKVLLAIQRGGRVCAADIDIDKLLHVIASLDYLEHRGWVCWQRAVDFGGTWKNQLRLAWEQNECLACNGPARPDGACKDRPPRLYQITPKGQEELLTALLRRSSGSLRDIMRGYRHG